MKITTLFIVLAFMRCDRDWPEVRYSKRVIIYTGSGTKGTCSGTKYCGACKNCKYCKHCAQNGGSCGVCK